MRDTDSLCFIDSNIWLYYLGEAESEPKFQIAESLIHQKGVFLSTQVINEVCCNLIKKFGFNAFLTQFKKITHFHKAFDNIVLREKM